MKKLLLLLFLLLPVWCGAGANRDTANTEIAYPTVDSTTGKKSCVPINSALTLGISGNSVDSATITIKLDLRRQ